MSINTQPKLSPIKQIKNLTFFSLFLCLFIILWGAWVRISFSGDGCGQDWPLCQNQFIPTFHKPAIWIEFTHRLTSGLYGLLICLILFLTLRQKNSSIRLFGKLVFIFMITEALVGALLVKKGLVGENSTVQRVYVMILHQLNSMALVGSSCWLYLTGRHDTALNKHATEKADFPYDYENQKKTDSETKNKAYYIAVFLILIACTGVIASLSTTLYPSDSLLTGIQNDLSSQSHILVRLRGSHPLMGFVFGFLILYLIQFSKNQHKSNHNLFTALNRLQILTSFQVGLGLVTLLSLSPVPLKIFHLATAHGVWILICTVYFHLKYADTKIRTSD